MGRRRPHHQKGQHLHRTFTNPSVPCAHVRVCMCVRAHACARARTLVHVHADMPVWVRLCDCPCILQACVSYCTVWGTGGRHGKCWLELGRGRWGHQLISSSRTLQQGHSNSMQGFGMWTVLTIKRNQKRRKKLVRGLGLHFIGLWRQRGFWCVVILMIRERCLS